MIPQYLNFLVNLILNQHFQNERCLFYLTDQQFGISAVETNIPVVVLRDENATFPYELLFSNYGCQGIVLHVQHPCNVFTELERQIRLHLDRFNERKYLILPTQKGSEIMEEFFAMSLTNYIADILFVVFERGWKKAIFNIKNDILDGMAEFYAIYTHQYIGSENSNRAVLLQKWKYNSTKHTELKNLYLDKLSNQMGRRLRIATFTYLPYSIPSKKT